MRIFENGEKYKQLYLNLQTIIIYKFMKFNCYIDIY